MYRNPTNQNPKTDTERCKLRKIVIIPDEGDGDEARVSTFPSISPNFHFLTDVCINPKEGIPFIFPLNGVAGGKGRSEGKLQIRIAFLKRFVQTAERQEVDTNNDSF